ncbi:conserved hypothetical protein (plasmid) [Rhodococcus jostii RHA1]|uniref:Uncharacterized protein n=1 Tax=Rhodococcus jostii (strain RHA1) TaxID=101510 RepID=Q0RX50_RHOJR|nr:conserved hypothetical protein [Rhodococcus jostii RHA1]
MTESVVGARASEGSPTTRPASSEGSEGPERDFATVLADYDEHDTLALAEIEQWSPRTRRIDERDFRSRPLPRGRCQVGPRPKTPVCSAGVTVDGPRACPVSVRAHCPGRRSSTSRQLLLRVSNGRHEVATQTLIGAQPRCVDRFVVQVRHQRFAVVAGVQPSAHLGGAILHGVQQLLWNGRIRHRVPSSLAVHLNVFRCSGGALAVMRSPVGGRHRQAYSRESASSSESQTIS